MKLCSHCKIEKNEDEFAWRYKAKGIRAGSCRLCQKMYNAAHHTKNGSKIRAQIYSRRRNIKVHFQTLKEKMSCIRCGESHPAILD